MEDIKITVVEEAGQRIDKILVKALTDFSRTQIQMLIQDGHVLVNGKAIKASYKVEVNDEVMVHIPEPESTDILAEDIPLDIVYEDQDVIVVNKPTGMIVHPSAGIYKGTLVNAYYIIVMIYQVSMVLCVQELCIVLIKKQVDY